MVFQYPAPRARIPDTSMTTKEMIAIVAVTAMLPVAVDPYGMRPTRLANRMKKNTERMYGVYASGWGPTLGSTTVWRRYNTSASMPAEKPPATPGSAVRRRWNAAADNRVATHRMDAISSHTTCLVGDRSIERPPTCTGAHRGNSTMQTNGECGYGRSRSCESVMCGVMKSIDSGLPASTRRRCSSVAADPWLKQLGYCCAPSRRSE